MTVKANKLRIKNVDYEINAATLNGHEDNYFATASDVGDLADLDTTDTSSIVDAINEVVDDISDVAGDLSSEVSRSTDVEGTLSSLTTTAQSNLVAAINEVDGHADTNATNIGTLSNLTTESKSNLVSAVNEVDVTARTVIFTTPAFSSLPQTFADNQLVFDGNVTHLTTDLCVTPNDYKLSNPSAMFGTWNLDFSTEGYVTISGTFNGSTGTTLTLWCNHS